MYTYNDTYWKEAQVDLEYLNKPESELFDNKNYKTGKNILFTHAKHKAFMRRMWYLLLEQFYEPEDSK